jgi:serine/threonine protein kinase, bacterial
MSDRKKPLPGSDKSGFLDRSNQNQAEGYNPSIVQMATSIRERRIKSIEANPKLNSAPEQEPKTKTWKAKSTKPSVSPPAKNIPIPRIDSHTLLSDYINGRRDFAMQDLSMLDLERVDLTEVNFHGCRLHKTNLHKAILFNSDLGQASLNQASLKDANLCRAYLSHADLEGADLRGADLSDAYLNHANLRGANLSGANLTNAKVSEEQLAMAKTNWMTIRPNGKRTVL